MPNDPIPLRPERPEATAEERARLLAAEVERLSRLPIVEWMIHLIGDASRNHGIEPAQLKAMIEATIKERDKTEKKAKTEQREEEQRELKQRRAREKEFAAILTLPSADQDHELIEAATRLEEPDIDYLRGEFLVYRDAQRTVGPGDTEVWPEPIDDLAALLNELRAQIRRYAIIHDADAEVAVVLWICFAWVHEVATHSPILTVRAGDADAGKTTLCGVLKNLTPRAYAAAEITGPGLYRFVDSAKPTIIVDDADNLLARKPDLVHIINVSWTRGTKIPRLVKNVTRWFDPFCPKIVAGIDLHLPNATATRCINVTLWPALPGEKVTPFNFLDDDTFATLRSKLARFADDAAPALATATPIAPAGFANRLAANWKLLLAIAELAGGEWKLAGRQAAVKLSRQRKDPSESRRVLAAFHDLFARQGELLTSEAVESALHADPSGEWVDFRGRGPITKRQIAVLLEPYGIRPGVIHPRGRRADRGYKRTQFGRAFRHYLPGKSAKKKKKQT